MTVQTLKHIHTNWSSSKTLAFKRSIFILSLISFPPYLYASIVCVWTKSWLYVLLPTAINLRYLSGLLDFKLIACNLFSTDWPPIFITVAGLKILLIPETANVRFLFGVMSKKFSSFSLIISGRSCLLGIHISPIRDSQQCIAGCHILLQ